MVTAETCSGLNIALAAEEEKLLACIHCGLCLQACPTYVQTGDENDSPRGRIYLMRAVQESRLSPQSSTFTEHINRCLGCRACEQACPSGVEYGQLLEAARNEIMTSGKERKPAQRILLTLLRTVWKRKWLLNLSFQLTKAFRATGLPDLMVRTRLAKLISPRLEFALELLEVSGPARFTKESPSHAAVSPLSKMKQAETVSIFKGCVMEGLFRRVNQATARVLEVNGYEVRSVEGQGCCGALHAHAGDLEGARELARRNIDAFENEGGAVITNAGGCGAMLASYDHLMVDDPKYAVRARAFSARVRDVSQQLANGVLAEGQSVTNDTVTYDASCHLIYGQHAGDAPVRMLGAVAGLNLIPLEGAEMCCGGAGVYNLMEPELSSAILDEKLENVRRTGAKILATGNPGCHMQIGAGARLSGMDLKICHPVELLDESYRQAGYYGEG